jgi:hypothetical protein
LILDSTIQSTLNFEDVVASLLSEEMRRKSMKGVAKDVLSVRGCPQDRKNKFEISFLGLFALSKSLIYDQYPMSVSLLRAYLNLEVDLNLQDNLQENAGNAVKLGIIRKIADLLMWIKERDLMMPLPQK